MSTQTFQNAERVNKGIFSSWEKRTLSWLAPRVPRWINSDHLTTLGFTALLLTGASYWFAKWDARALLAGIALLAVNWFGDSLDGTLARFRNAQRPRYGFYVDHIIDVFGTFFLIGGMALSGLMSPGLAAGLLIVYLMVSIEVYLATYTLGKFHLSFMKFGPTELRILLAIGNLRLLHNPTVHLAGHQWLLLDCGAVVAIVGMAGALIWSSIGHGVQLYKLERIA